MWVTIVGIVLWLLVGIANMCCEKISKPSYLCAWFIALVAFVSKLIETI